MKNLPFKYEIINGKKVKIIECPAGYAWGYSLQSWAALSDLDELPTAYEKTLKSP